MFGGNRSGKTECGAVECLWILRGIHPYRKNRKDAFGWAVSLPAALIGTGDSSVRYARADSRTVYFYDEIDGRSLFAIPYVVVQNVRIGGFPPVQRTVKSGFDVEFS